MFVATNMGPKDSPMNNGQPPPSVDADFPAPLQVLFTPKRYKVLYGGRGAGRSWGVARALLLLGAQQPRRVLCARELQNSIRDSVHKLLGDQVILLGLQNVYDVQQSVIKTWPGVFPQGQQSEFSFEGIRHNVNKIKSYEGVDDCWVEEGANVTENSWEVLIPTIRKPDSRIIVTFNPELESDATYQRFVINKLPPEMCDLVYTTWRDNPWFPDVLRQEMEELRSRNYDAYLHVWEGHCRSMLDGVIFADELRSAMAQGRIRDVPYDRATPVNVYFDLGRADHTSMWFVQQVGFEYHLIDFYQNNLKHIDHYLKAMQDRQYVYDTIWLPHDAKAQTLGSKMSIEEQVRANRSWAVRIVPRLKITDRLNAARSVFPQCWFDKRHCEPEGLRSLKLYRYDVDPQTKQYSTNPVHDDASDAADAFCYFAVAAKKGSRRGSLSKILETARAKISGNWDAFGQSDAGPN